MTRMYQIRRPSRSETVPVRHHRYHVRIWGDAHAGTVPLVMVHGWMDVSASYQFVVDAMAHGHYVIAPDWRGYGLTQADPVDNYWFPDYMADLDFLLDHYAGDRPVHLVGHSMGGNVAMLYAGVRPARIRRLVNLEGFGAVAHQPEEAPRRYASWIDELKRFHRGEIVMRGYDSADGVARRLMKTNHRLPQDKADWLARQWAQPATGADGTQEWHILGDAAHKLGFAHLSRVDEHMALYRSITAPVLAIEASDNSLERWWKGRYSLAEYHTRLGNVADCRIARVEDAGHMLHHDQPEQVARLIEDFLQ